MKSLSEICKRKIHETTFEILDHKNGPALLQWYKGLKDLPKALKQDLLPKALKQDLQNEADKIPTSKKYFSVDITV